MRLPIAFAALALAGAGGQPAGGDNARATTPSKATTAFAALIKSRYGDQPGLRRCARVDYSKTELACWAEIYRGKQRRMVSATASIPDSTIVFRQVRSRSWTRRWTSVPARVVRSFGAPGTASANSPAFDRAFLIGFAYDAFNRHKLPATSVAVDGDRSGMPDAMFRFRCTLSGRLITCTNALGDALRYRP
jgi:hypothetical protein